MAASVVSCGRAMKGAERDYKSLMESMLPRGPVPPSGPSLCHNKLSPYRYKQLSFPEDYYIICP
ncbi:hypothetical protein TIFTF001_007963 [Ficus carica]|uniref:Uncharacterized protein n=1 Tax=Ficus carica TaxID=3494 RepID=A0AA87ZRA7_FICCA|nr:hypothetical protein TIFTF001_007963 [Ficus carica]